MKVQDNGKGLPEGLDITSTDSFGLMLVGTFVDLLDGDLKSPRKKELFLILPSGSIGKPTTWLLTNPTLAITRG